MEEVVIMVKGGVVELISRPANVKVICRDYDCEGLGVDLEEDEHGSYKEFKL